MPIKSLLRNILINLISNAAKFSGEGFANSQFQQKVTMKKTILQ